MMNTSFQRNTECLNSTGGSISVKTIANIFFNLDDLIERAMDEMQVQS
jgi:hypothetical protein